MELIRLISYQSELMCFNSYQIGIKNIPESGETWSVDSPILPRPPKTMGSVHLRSCEPTARPRRPAWPTRAIDRAPTHLALARNRRINKSNCKTILYKRQNCRAMFINSGCVRCVIYPIIAAGTPTAQYEKKERSTSTQTCVKGVAFSGAPFFVKFNAVCHPGNSLLQLDLAPFI